MKWFRHYHGCLTDPKFGSIARRTGQTRERVLFVWLSILESASEADNRGEVTTDIYAVADVLNCDEECIDAIWQEFEARGMIENGRVSKWNERNPDRDDSAARMRKKRQKTANVTRSDAVCANSDALDTDTDTDTESKKERGGANAQPEYAFSGRVIRLKAEDLTRWRKAYHAVPDLMAEIEAADAYYAEKPPPNGKWFFAASNWLKKSHQDAVAKKTSDNDDDIYAAVL